MSMYVRKIIIIKLTILSTAQSLYQEDILLLFQRSNFQKLNKSVDKRTTVVNTFHDILDLVSFHHYVVPSSSKTDTAT